MDEITFCHHGIKGMKWGVRRYQNYDGTYTKRGLERYRKAESDYDNAKKKQKDTKMSYKKGSATKQDVKDANQQVKSAKRKMSNAYDKLKTDKLADEGKQLYKQGHTITGNSKMFAINEVGIIVGSNVVSGVLAAMGKYNLAIQSGRIIGVGGTVANAIIAGKNYRENKRLRAYYAH